MKRFKQQVVESLETLLPEQAILLFLKHCPNWPKPTSEVKDLDRFYPKLAGWNSDNLWGTMTPEDVERLILSGLSRRAIKVLDVGCGLGTITLAIALARRQASVTGIDIVPDFIQSALGRQRTKFPELTNIRFKVGSATNLPFPDASVDQVLSVDSLCHLRDKPSALKELRRVLQPGGTLFILDWAATPDTPPNLPALCHCPEFWNQRQYRAALEDHLPSLNIVKDTERFVGNLHTWIDLAAHRPRHRGLERRKLKMAVVFMRYVLWCLETERLAHLQIVGEKPTKHSRLTT